MTMYIDKPRCNDQAGGVHPRGRPVSILTGKIANGPNSLSDYSNVGNEGVGPGSVNNGGMLKDDRKNGLP